MKFNNKPLFPYTYGDVIINDEERMSDFIIEIAKNKKLQNIISVTLSTMFVLGAKASAMPPEAGGHVASAAEAAVEGGKAANLIPEGARAAAEGVNGAARVPLPLLVRQPAPAPGTINVPGAALGQPGGPLGPGGPGAAPGKPPIMLPIARPESSLARGVNTFAFLGSIGYVCLNAYWGNPVALAGCFAMVTTWLGSTLGLGFTKLGK